MADHLTYTLGAHGYGAYSECPLPACMLPPCAVQNWHGRAGAARMSLKPPPLAKRQHPFSPLLSFPLSRVRAVRPRRRGAIRQLSLKDASAGAERT